MFNWNAYRYTSFEEEALPEKARFTIKHISDSMEKYTATEQFIIKLYKWYKLRSKLQQYLIDDHEAARDIIEEVVG